MRPVNQKTLDRIKSIVDAHINAFIFNTIGEDMLTEEEKLALEGMGLLLPKSKALLNRAFLLGVFSMHVADGDTLTLEEWMNALKERSFKFSPAEKAALKYINDNPYKYIKHLGDVISMNASNVVLHHSASRAKEKAKQLGDTIAEGVAKRKTAKNVALDLRRALQIAAKDFMILATTEMHNAYQEGRAQVIAEKGKKRGYDPRVFKKPRPDACKHCVRLHTTNGKVPKVYKLSELSKNGVNVGRQKHEWRAVVGATHPSCRCPLSELPPGFSFDSNGAMVYVGRK